MNARLAFGPGARRGGLMRRLLLGLLCVWAGLVAAQKPEANGPVQLLEHFAALRSQAERSPFGPLMYLQSREAESRLQGDVYALVDHPYAEVRQALGRAEHWCDILILHLNVKYCRASGAAPQVLDVGVGRKFDQPLADAYWVRFAYRVVHSEADYLQVVLNAPSGPMGTRDYLIAAEVAPLDAGRSVVHMTYTYSYDAAARWAMKAYLSTLGSGKVGFSVVGKRGSGEPEYVGGVRGVVERNAMRYYLAIESFLGAYRLPPAPRLTKSLQDWFAATERHARQLHEMERDEYLTMKQAEIRRQQVEAPARR